MGVVAARFEDPVVTMKRGRFTAFQVSSNDASMTFEVDIHLKNPNDWPIEATMEQLVADVHSLDKLDDTGTEYFLSTANLPDPVIMETQSETEFTVQISFVVEPSASVQTVALLARLNRDCGLLANPKETKLRVTIKDSKAKFLGVGIDLTGIDIPLEMVVPCN